MNGRIKELETENEKLKKYILKLESELKTKNKRGAGRKQKLTNTQMQEVKMYRMQDKTIGQIADMYNVSVGLIHKIIKG